MSAELEYQKAVIDLLRADATLSAAVTSVRDMQHPVSAADGGDGSLFPYVNVEPRLRDWSTHTGSGFDVETRIHTWSRTGSFKECKTIQGLIYGLLHRAALTVPGQNVLFTDRMESDCMLDPDGLTVHGVCEYRSLMQTT